MIELGNCDLVIEVVAINRRVVEGASRIVSGCWGPEEDLVSTVTAACSVAIIVQEMALENPRTQTPVVEIRRMLKAR